MSKQKFDVFQSFFFQLLSTAFPNYLIFFHTEEFTFKLKFESILRRSVLLGILFLLENQTNNPSPFVEIFLVRLKNSNKKSSYQNRSNENHKFKPMHLSAKNDKTKAEKDRKKEEATSRRFDKER